MQFVLFDMFQDTDKYSEVLGTSNCKAFYGIPMTIVRVTLVSAE